MKRVAMAYVLLASGAFSCKARKAQLSEEKFYSSQAAIVQMTFESQLIVLVPKDFQNDVSGLLKSDYKTDIDRQIADQLDYLTGSLLNYKLLETYPGVVNGRPTISNIRIAVLNGDATKALVKYSYSDIGTFNKAVVDSRAVTIPVVLPAFLDGFYNRAKSEDGKVNCLGAGGSSDEEKFWYYWKPDAKNCALKITDYIEVVATLAPKAQTVSTYPFNDLIHRDPGSGRRYSDVTLMFGASVLDPNEEKTVQELVKMGFKERVAKDKDLRTFYFSQEGHADINLSLWLLDGGTEKFKKVAAEALTKADMFVYAGHSNYGGFFDPKVLGLTSQSFDQNKSQIFFFNGCRSFRYYNAKFFDLKPKKLNIVTTSVPSYSITFPATVPTFLKVISDDRRLSWQNIIDQIQIGETKALTESKWENYPYITWPKFKALISVNGDENNPGR